MVSAISVWGTKLDSINAYSIWLFGVYSYLTNGADPTIDVTIVSVWGKASSLA